MEYGDGAVSSQNTPRSDRSIAILDNRDAKIKQSSPTADALLKESLHVQSSSKTCVTTATTQLKVLCRKFAVLSEKVKQEAKLREDAEKEVKRLNELLEGTRKEFILLHKSIEDAQNPLITSTRTDAQQYIRSQQEELYRVREELHHTKEELCHVKQELDRMRAQGQTHIPYHQQVDPQAQWDREQTMRIQETLSCTISELHEELNVKETEIESLRASIVREKAKHKELEETVVTVETQNREDKEMLSKMTHDLRDVTMTQANEIEKLHLAQESVKEERTIKEALQHQISTLHQVNDALQKRCDALVRRLQLNSNLASETQSLKSQLHEVETQNETLIRELKQSHFQDAEHLKAALHQTQSVLNEAEKRITELQSELTSMRIQNNTMSEFMMYGSKRAKPYDQRYASESFGSQPHSPVLSQTYPLHHTQQNHPTYQSNQRSSAPPQIQTTPTRHQTYQSPYPSPGQNLHSSYHSSSTYPKASHGCDGKHSTSRGPQAPFKSAATVETPSVNQTIPDLSMATREQYNEKPKSNESDHSILRALKNRNKELQERLQQEADATFQLEEEINMITSSYHTLLQNE